MSKHPTIHERDACKMLKIATTDQGVGRPFAVPWRQGDGSRGRPGLGLDRV